MNAFDTWLSIIVLTIATIISRSSFFVFGNVVKLPPRVQQALRYAPAAALAAIVAPDLLLSANGSAVDWFNPKLLASSGAAVFFLATRSLLGTIIFGMGLFTVLRLSF